jgi:hypothetical protein
MEIATSCVVFPRRAYTPGTDFGSRNYDFQESDAVNSFFYDPISTHVTQLAIPNSSVEERETDEPCFGIGRFGRCLMEAIRLFLG